MFLIRESQESITFENVKHNRQLRRIKRKEKRKRGNITTIFIASMAEKEN